MAQFLTLGNSQTRQLIDSLAVFREYRLAAAAAVRYRGGMYWKRQGEYEYLVRTEPGPGKRQHRIGIRSVENERVYAQFLAEKNQADSRHATLKAAFQEAERMNKALRVGRTPPLLVKLLATLDTEGLGHHFVVVGTNALYAYETAAQIRFAASAMATQDIDILWDARRRMQFATDLTTTSRTMLQLLRKVDPTFRRDEDKKESARNASGQEVEFLRRMKTQDDEHPFAFSADADDMYVVQAPRAGVLTSARRFNHPVVATTGQMALMRTVDPQVFVDFKRWMSKLQGRESGKRDRDAAQAGLVQDLLAERMLMPEQSMDELAGRALSRRVPLAGADDPPA